MSQPSPGPAMSVPAGTKLGPYEVIAPLGSGGMGEVYRARDTRLGREVAIKVLPADRLADTDSRTRFEREARAVAALNHPHINLLGRTHEAAVWVEHPRVSRRHAVIRVAGATATIEDCGSKNGTFVGDERVVGRRELFAGDDIRLGQAWLRLGVYQGDPTTQSDDDAPRRP
jgi:FHA domain/Protein kinase domain